MKTILLKISNFLTSRNFNLGFYAFSTGFFGEQTYCYLSSGHVGWGLLFLAVALYDLTYFILWLTNSRIDISVKIIKRAIKKESV